MLIATDPGAGGACASLEAFTLIHDRCAFQYAPHLLPAPEATAGSRDALGVQPCRNLPEGDSAGSPQFLDDRRQVGGSTLGPGLARRKARNPAFVADDRQVAPGAVPPGLCPFAAARTSLVRLEIMRRSSSATIPMISTVSWLALGIPPSPIPPLAFSTPERK
jgi:hypothetical protein